MSNVTTFVSIKVSVLDKDEVVCSIFPGDVLLFRHPDRMYLSF